MKLLELYFNFIMSINNIYIFIYFHTYALLVFPCCIYVLIYIYFVFIIYIGKVLKGGNDEYWKKGSRLQEGQLGLQKSCKLCTSWMRLIVSFAIQFQMNSNLAQNINEIFGHPAKERKQGLQCIYMGCRTLQGNSYSA